MLLLVLKKIKEKIKHGVDIAASDQIRSVTQSCPTLCDPVDCSILGFPVLH